MIKRLKDLKKTILESQVWRSMFRHDYADTPRNRTLQIMSNVWMHLHPPKIRRHAIRIRFTWCMGGITFLLFLVLTVTGVVLMFYYRPVAEYAYADMKYLQFDVPFGMLVRNMHRWAAHGMVLTVWLHMFRVFMTGSYKSPRSSTGSSGSSSSPSPCSSPLQAICSRGTSSLSGRSRWEPTWPGRRRSSVTRVLSPRSPA